MAKLDCGLGNLSTAKCHQVHISPLNHACIWLVQIRPLGTFSHRYLCAVVNETCPPQSHNFIICHRFLNIQKLLQAHSSQHSDLTPLAIAIRVKERCWISISLPFAFSQTHIPVNPFWLCAICQHQKTTACWKCWMIPFHSYSDCWKPRSMQCEWQTKSLEYCAGLFRLYQV